MTAVAVCGFGRCGSSMVMRMLDAGGIPPAGEVSPLSYELAGSAGWAEMTRDDLNWRAIKPLDAVLHGLMPDVGVGWQIIWLDRDRIQQARSMVKLLRSVGVDLERDAVKRLARSYRDDRPRALDLLRTYGPILELDYEQVLRRPGWWACVLREFLAPEFNLNAVAAANVVHRRRPYCAPDLTFEATGSPA